jgi:prepilin-type N-terminal cleavage/methylation domain-containing protein
MKTNAKKGFTLIELLIVIAIIGILAAALLPNILGAPKSANDTARKVAVNDMIIAIEQYKATNNALPGTAATGECITQVSTVGAKLTGLVKDGIGSLITSKKLNVAMDLNPCTSLVYYQDTLASGNYYVCVGMEIAGQTSGGFYSLASTAPPVKPGAAAAAGSNVWCIKN